MKNSKIQVGDVITGIYQNDKFVDRYQVIAFKNGNYEVYVQLLNLLTLKFEDRTYAYVDRYARKI